MTLVAAMHRQDRDAGCAPEVKAFQEPPLRGRTGRKAKDHDLLLRQAPHDLVKRGGRGRGDRSERLVEAGAGFSGERLDRLNGTR